MRPVAGLLGLGLSAAAVLVVRLALDFTRLAPAIGAVVWVFALAFLALVGSQVVLAWRGGAGPGALPVRTRIGLCAAVPCALAGSQLDCMGTLFSGCTPACHALSTLVAPAVALAVLVHAAFALRGAALASLALALPLLVPNCTCRNPVNAFWIDALGRSPACYASSFAVTLLVAAALWTRRLVAPSLVLAWGTVAILTVFFVGHHVYGWPW